MLFPVNGYLGSKTVEWRLRARSRRLVDYAFRSWLSTLFGSTTCHGRSICQMSQVERTTRSLGLQSHRLNVLIQPTGKKRFIPSKLYNNTLQYLLFDSFMPHNRMTFSKQRKKGCWGYATQVLLSFPTKELITKVLTKCYKMVISKLSYFGSNAGISGVSI
jgi:hypothetical protein